MYAVGFPFNEIARLHSAAYYQTEDSSTNSFLEVLRKERILQSFKNSKKTFPKRSLLL